MDERLLKNNLILDEDNDMSNKKYQVFISSTYSDLKNERMAVYSCLLDCDCIPVGMEQFPSVPIDQWKYIKRMIDSSDYYLLIVAGRYGSIEKNSGLSYTEKEFDYAMKKGMPIMAFLTNDDVEFSKQKEEQKDELKAKLKGFRNKVMNSGLLCSFYDDKDDLKYKVIRSVRRIIMEFPAVGWIRADMVEEYLDSSKQSTKGVLETVLSINQGNDSVTLSKEASLILNSACAENANGTILVCRTLAGISVSSGEDVFCDESSGQVAAKWVGAVIELQNKGFVDDPKGKDTVFLVTNEGYKYYSSIVSITKNLNRASLDRLEMEILDLIESKGGCTRTEIAENLGIGLYAISNKIKGLRNKKLIDYSSDNNHGGRKLIAK